MVRFPIPLPDLHAWKGWTSQNDTTQGIIKRNWVPTGRIDLATHVTGNEDADEPADFEIRRRQATLREARIVVVQYHKYLVENSLIKFVVDEAALVPPIPPVRKLAKPEAETSVAPEASAAA